jgi:dTDP-4-amino-4,6-dideoxygalactose transaminase
MLGTRFAPWPSYTEEEAEAVRRILLSNKVNYWTGDECRDFEAEFAKWSETRYAIALANGTVALEASLRALDVGPGDEVIVTPRSFLASASCVINVGARPVFADVERDSQNISAATIARVLTKRTKAVICVHLAGWPCDMGPIMELAAEREFFVVEDCAQAHGARYKGRPVGSIGHLGSWSFCQDKIITTGGEGGMITTNDRDLWARIWSYKDHGKSWSAVYEREHPPGFRWLHETIGTNWRMTEMQAAIGRIQLRRMPDWHAPRLSNATAIWSACSGLQGLRVPDVPEFVEHAAYKCYVFAEPTKLRRGWNRDRILESVNASGVPCYTGSCPELYLEKAFDNTASRPSERLPVARELGETSLMLLVHPTLTSSQIHQSCEVIGSVMREASSP